MFNNARWISAKFYPDMLTANAEEVVRSAYLRRVFAVNKKVSTAELTICALGLGVYYINGQKVTEDVLCTPYTIYDKRVCVNKYDVTHLLKEGDNCIAVHLGNGFYNNNMESWKDKMAPWRDIPKLILSLHITYTDGTEEYLDSNRTFKSYPGPVMFNHMRQGEVYDARYDEEGFSKADFCDDHWEYARRANHPGGVYELTNMPPITVAEEYSPIGCENGIYDFGVNISGWVKIKVKGERGTKIRLSYDERLSDDGKHLYASWKFPQIPDDQKVHWRGSNALALIEGLPYAHIDEYILKGGEEEIWSPSFCFHAFRYVKIENAPKDFEITAQFIHSEFEKIATFESSNEILNKLYDMANRSFLCNNVGYPTDCPHREQNGWAGEGLYGSMHGLISFDIKNYYKGWLRNYRDLQRPSGQIPVMLPTAYWGYNWALSMGGDITLVKIPYFTYLCTGDKSLIEESWDVMCKYVEYMENVTEDGVLEYDLSADWSSPGNIAVCPPAARDTAMAYDFLVTMSKLAKIIGKDEKIWLEKAEKYKKTWRDVFLTREELHESQTFMLIAVYTGVLEPFEEKQFIEKIAQHIKKLDYHFNCGVESTLRMFVVLSENGYMDYVYKAVTNETYPSYAYWVKSGLTTLPEDWDMSQSQNHQSFGVINYWLYCYVGGIRHTDDGILIEPIKLQDVDYVKVTHKGIEVERNKDEVKVTLPSKARVKIGETDKEFDAGTYMFSF